MKAKAKSIILILMITICQAAWADDNPGQHTNPSFPGGKEALLTYISENTEYPEEARKQELGGRVVVTFYIEKDGSVSDVRVPKPVHPLLDNEAVRVVSSMPKWSPATRGGITVRTHLFIPITFGGKGIAAKQTMPASTEPLPVVIADDKAEIDSSVIFSKYVFPEDVKPLISTQWGQHYPFNLLCPVTDKSNEESQYKLAGCGPVAMAQVVNYHRYPSMSPDGEYEYDWGLMFNTLNAYVQKRAIIAVAKLISDCGVSSFTEYGDDASSTFLDFSMGAMKRLFGYSNEMSIYNRSDFLTPKRDSLYRQIIFSELKAGRPILYRGTNKKGEGHMFIIDGCKKDKVHVNMGWAGDSNGYYDLNDLGGYSQQHWMLVDVADSGYQAATKEVAINEAGTLVKLLTPEERLTTRHIKLKGKMNGIDFFTLREMSKKGLLRTINMEEVEIEALPDTAFSNCFYLSHFVAPRTLKRMGNQAFSNCSNLNYAVFHDGLQEVGNAAFIGCRNLLAVRLPETITRIGYNAYTSCNTLLSVTLPDGVSEIGNYAFSYCKHLYAINLPKSLQKIGKEVFKDCNRLKYIRLDPENPFFTVNEKKQLVETGK